ncbi:hypothetical protein DUNSADRAFT_15595 [Dunaliella salina]|uniref:Uncharacterized protein n=1 Tax=Dunaliella salina TaxID=3046 RepID=A0ABQ7G540_DUNSA|nr:hypothetical protein DUNSADRAFT_15595 [Dunaliella salina]|eukprot:KAF5829715.1 hypothetical protein DUNSADRAFT_15595 [Dunaliella salina]
MLANKSLMMPQTRLPVAVPRLPQRLSVKPMAKAANKVDSVEEQPQQSKLALPFATVLAGALISSAIMPDDAMAAKSQGRVGGTSGFRSSRAATRAAPQQSTTTVNNTVIGAPAVAPPVYSYAPSPFGGFGGFGGFSIMPTFVMPFPFFGGILQFFLLMFVVSVVFNIVRAIASSASNNSSGGNKKDDGWGDL